MNTKRSPHDMIYNALRNLDIGDESAELLALAVEYSDAEAVLLAVTSALHRQRIAALESALAAAEAAQAQAERKPRKRDGLSKYRNLSDVEFRRLPLAEQVKVYKAGPAGRAIYDNAYGH